MAGAEPVSRQCLLLFSQVAERSAFLLPSQVADHITKPFLLLVHFLGLVFWTCIWIVFVIQAWRSSAAALFSVCLYQHFFPQTTSNCVGVNLLLCYLPIYYIPSMALFGWALWVDGGWSTYMAWFSIIQIFIFHKAWTSPYHSAISFRTTFYWALCFLPKQTIPSNKTFV